VLLLSTSGETNMLACYCVNCVAVCVCVCVCVCCFHESERWCYCYRPAVRLTCLRVTVLIAWQCVREQMCVPSILMFGHSMPLFFIRCRMHCSCDMISLFCSMATDFTLQNKQTHTSESQPQAARHQRAFLCR